MARTRVTIVGCGFIGTAVAIAIRGLYKDIEIIGHDKDQSKTQRAEKLKAIDRSNWNLPSACENAQLIVLSIPLDAIEPTLKAIAPDILPGAIITDTCPVKSPLTSFVRKYIPEKSAYISSDIVFNPVRVPASTKLDSLSADAFKGAAWTLTPLAASPDSVDSFASLVSATGAKPIFMDAIEHDGLRLAVDSIPSVVSSAFMLAVTSDAAWRERQWLAGSTFDAATTNVDGIHAEEVARALIAQRDASSHWINETMRQLIDLRDAVEAGQIDTVTAMLTTASEHRDRWSSEWFRGRDEGQAQVEVKRPSFLSMFVGTRLASRVEESTGKGSSSKKNGGVKP
jgi:prephenate dehydrogenase